MNTTYILLIVFGFILLEAISRRNNREKKEPINFFLTLHRLFIQRKKIQTEDIILVSSLGFVMAFSYVILNLNFTISLEKGVEAQTKFRPKVNQEKTTVLEYEPDPLAFKPAEKKEEDFYAEKETSNLEFEVKAGKSILETAEAVELKLVKVYEESVFSSLPAKIKSEINWEAEDFFLPSGKIKSDLKASGKKSVEASIEAYEAGDLAVSDPTTLQPAGTFEVKFFVKTNNNKTKKEVIRLEVIDEHENKVLFEQSIKETLKK